ncbi:metallophosphoesterase [Pseudoduganella albidiflava]|uniref:Metallophosphoesterase n=1 Tax=Pseudoduganella albidiflava TaxID=321983 RepID=A0ABX5RUR0_9BURK|nr:metallophosphoesterase [Pseudoduganella albidiflava]
MKSPSVLRCRPRFALITNGLAHDGAGSSNDSKDFPVLPIVNLVLGAYLIWRYVWTLRLGVPGKAALAALLMALIEHHWLVARVFGGTIASPEIPRAALIGVSVAYGTLATTAVLLLLRDLAGLAAWLPSRAAGRAILGNRAAPHVFLAASLVLAGIGVAQAIKVPAVKQLEVALPGLPAELDGYQVAHLTDLHLSRLLQAPWAAATVAATNAAAADLIVISGDLVDGTPAARAADVAPLAGLSARDGVFAVAGNHEYYADYVAWMRKFDELGIDMLENRHVVIRQGFVLAGVPDQMAARHGQRIPDTAAALAGKPAGLPVVLLDHRPANVLHNQPLGVDLQLSGHTHGGHAVGLDWIIARFNKGFVSGRYAVGRGMLYVSNGAGLWPGFPIRLGRPSDITLITLRTARPVG